MKQIYALLNIQWVTEEIKEEIKINVDKNTMIQHLWDAVTSLKGKVCDDRSSNSEKKKNSNKKKPKVTSRGARKRRTKETQKLVEGNK